MPGNKTSGIPKRFRVAFLLLESVFYVFFLACDILGKNILFSSTVWKFSVIVSALLYVAFEFLLTKRGDRLWRRRLFLLFAMVMTLVSDVFLLVLDSNYTVGVCTFFLAQLFHALEIPRSKKRAAVSFSLRFGATAIVLIGLALSKLFEPLYVAVAFYAPQLVGNLIEHFFGIFLLQDREERRRSLILAVGFLLFFGCDLCVGLSNIGVGGVGIWIWAFYAPSQAFIAISSGRFYHEKTTD